MILLKLSALLLVTLTGCSMIQHENMVRNQTAQEQVRESNKTARHKQSSSDAVRLAAVQGASTVTVRHPGQRPPACPDLTKQEAEFKDLCENHTEGSGDVNIDREAVCTPLRAALDQLRNSCTEGGSGEQAEVVFRPSIPSSAGVNINLTGASTRDIRFIIQSPGAADQSTNGVQDVPAPVPPESVVAGMSNGLFDLLGKAMPWAIGGYALGEFADAFEDGVSNAGDRYTNSNNPDNSDNSISTKIATEIVE